VTHYIERTMKRIALFLALAVAAHAASNVAMFGWQESRDEKSGERKFGFFVATAAVRKVFEATANGNTSEAQALSAKLPKDAWMYALLLTGEAKSYAKEKITLFEPKPCGSILELVSGTVDVDRKTGTVRVALKVRQDDKLIDFVGNGAYRIAK
jgi:hypothetical protein